MSDDERDFNNMDTRAVIKFFFLQGKAPKDIHAILIEKLGEYAPSYVTIKNWVAQFKRGDFSTCDDPRPGRSKTVTTPEIIDQIDKLILEDRRISAKSIAEQLDISHERVGSIIHEDLDMRKLSARSEQLLESFRRDPNDFLSRLVTMDETWLYHYHTETKQQSVEWRHSGSARSKNPEYKNPLENFSPWFFGIKTASSSLIIFQRAKLSTRSIIHLCWCN